MFELNSFVDTLVVSHLHFLFNMLAKATGVAYMLQLLLVSATVTGIVGENPQGKNCAVSNFDDVDR